MTQDNPQRTGKGLIPAHIVARRLAVSVRTVRNWARTGILPATKLGPKLWRFDAADVEAFLTGKKTGGAS